MSLFFCEFFLFSYHGFVNTALCHCFAVPFFMFPKLVWFGEESRYYWEVFEDCFYLDPSFTSHGLCIVWDVMRTVALFSFQDVCS